MAANAGNSGNAGGAGGGGNATGVSTGWFFADRVDLPFVTVNSPAPPPPLPIIPGASVPIAALRSNIPQFPLRNWAADWYAWLVLYEFVQGGGWDGFNILLPGMPTNHDWTTYNASPAVQQELTDLATAAQDERANALGEIVAQSDEFISYLLNLMTARPGAYPNTAKVLTIANMIAAFVMMYYKAKHQRPRPSQLLPALLPPLEVPGHASFPSGHSTQSHLMVLCMNDVLAGKAQQQAVIADLWVLADRIARNREIAGLHYASDTAGGVDLARKIMPLLQALPHPSPTVSGWYQAAVTAAAAEW